MQIHIPCDIPLKKDAKKVLASENRQSRDILPTKAVTYHQ